VHEHQAVLIVIGAPAKRRLARTREEAFFGHTVDFVLRKAPCRVIVEHFPPESPEDEFPSEEGEVERRALSLSRVRGRAAPRGSTG
jgi:hypothetical protein